MVGKWHLGHADRKYWPQNRGFDHFYGNLVGEVDYFTKERGGIIDWQRDGKFLKEDGYFTTLIGNEAVNIIKEHDTAKPLFLYVASLAPHAPYQAPQKDIDAYKNTAGDVHRHTYAAMITDLDTQVGRIVAALKQKNMLDNTLIIFSSDNGGATNALFATGARSPEERERKRRRGAWRKNSRLERRSSRRQGIAARRRRACADYLLLARQAQAGGRQRAGAHGGRDADGAGTRRRQGQSRPSVRRQGHLADPGERPAFPTRGLS